ncbi:Cell adhesion molecule 2 [Dissostichus eleginoides]|uniref:Cell adhesion molecule 2 n=1 Tax=Dissostichus eleginoides TaxID=100907 RepID=A0AAD9BGF5_DISEL|nr:Cell adhesion molecule 2 [Dissostichus eleginoides]
MSDRRQEASGISGQYPLVQNMTVTEGGTVNMTCRVEYNDNTSLQWSNPAQQTLFFGDKKGYSISHQGSVLGLHFMTFPVQRDWK